MRWLVTLGLLLLPSTALAVPQTIQGYVIDTRGYWSDDGRTLLTDAVVRTPDGDRIVTQLGGHADGLTMRIFDGDEPLVVGMQVALAAHDDMDLQQRSYTVIDSVKVLAWPQGFVRTGPTQAGHYLYWESGCAFVTPDSGGTKEIAGDTEFDIIEQCVATWNDATDSCSYLQLKLQDKAAHEVGRDDFNVIKFRDISWCRPASGGAPPKCYAPSAAGITTAVFVDDPTSARDGAIVDADVELNGVDFAIAANGQTFGTQSCQAELQNTLTHELGHLQGLEHPCLATGDPPRIDDKGQPVPSCSATTDPVITEATMYNFQECGETKKASLSDDDVNAICTIYPENANPDSCEPVGVTPGCCGASASSDPTGALALTGIVLVLVGRRRRKV
jgi:MYXO-CTERM domain-containing protein